MSGFQLYFSLWKCIQNVNGPKRPVSVFYVTGDFVTWKRSLFRVNMCKWQTGQMNWYMGYLCGIFVTFCNVTLSVAVSNMCCQVGTGLSGVYQWQLRVMIDWYWAPFFSSRSISMKAPETDNVSLNDDFTLSILWIWKYVSRMTLKIFLHSNPCWSPPSWWSL